MTPGTFEARELSPPIGKSLEESPDQLRESARPIPYGRRVISDLTPAEALAFADALADL